MESNLSREDEKKVGVYLMHNPETNMGYIGSGILGRPRSEHLRALKLGAHYNHRLQKAYDENPNFEFIATVVEGDTFEESRTLALELEQSEIDTFWGPGLLNIARHVDAPMTGYKHSEESNEKNRQAAKKRWQDDGYRQVVLQRQVEGKAQMTPEEHAQRNAKLSTSIKRAYDEGRRISNAGQVRPEEFRERTSANIAEKWQDPEYREKQRQSKMGNRNAPMCPIMGDGIEYPSIVDAARAQGVSPQSIQYRLSSSNYPGWFKKT